MGMEESKTGRSGRNEEKTVAVRGNAAREGMLRVLLLNFESGSYGYRMISACLKESGFDVYNVFMGGHETKDGWKVSEAEVRSFDTLLGLIKPQMVGLSILTLMDHPNAARITDFVKSKTGIPVVWGGVYPTLMPRYCLENSAADYICIGEGEETVVDICNTLRNEEPADDIAGVMGRRNFSYARRKPVKNLDNLPIQDFGNEKAFCIREKGAIYEGDPLLNGFFMHGDGNYPTRASRGCPFQCTYCTIEAMKKLYDPGTYLRRRSVDGLMEELKRILAVKPELNYISFWDEIFPSRQEWIEEFSEKYRKHISLPFSIFSSPFTINEKCIASLVAAGLDAVYIGIQSASEKTRREVYGRTETNETVFNNHRILSAHKGLDIVYDFIIEHPWESPTELEETFNMVMAFKKPFQIKIRGLILFPRTDLEKRAIQEGYMKEGELANDMVNDPAAFGRLFNWSKSIPLQKNIQRAFWLFLITCAVNGDIPENLLKYLAGANFLRNHPELLTGNLVMDMSTNAEFASQLSSKFKSSRILKLLPFVGASLDKAPTSGRTMKTYFYGYLFFRIVGNMPSVISKSVSNVFSGGDRGTPGRVD